jgi:dephospho-CoA kinase
MFYDFPEPFAPASSYFCILKQIVMFIIGITGTLGAGKGTIVDYLKEKRNFRHYSVREYLIKEIDKQGFPVNRDSMTSVANRLRSDHHPAYIVEELYKQAVRAGENAVIESIRTPGEVDFLRKQSSFCLFAVDADPKIRYRRIRQRASETDHIDFETFISNEAREMSTTDPSKQNLSRCIQMADFRFDNNGDVTSLYTRVDLVLRQITK